MLSVENLTRPGLEAASFDLADRECLALSGPSGSGKSLLLRALADLVDGQQAVLQARADLPAL